jgi:hypothetical protein
MNPDSGGEMHYLKLDQTMPHPYGRALWVPLIEGATPFKSDADAQNAKRQVSDASGVIQDDEYWYVVKA